MGGLTNLKELQTRGFYCICRQSLLEQITAAVYSTASSAAIPTSGKHVLVSNLNTSCCRFVCYFLSSPLKEWGITFPFLFQSHLPAEFSCLCFHFSLTTWAPSSCLQSQSLFHLPPCSWVCPGQFSYVVEQSAWPAFHMWPAHVLVTW